MPLVPSIADIIERMQRDPDVDAAYAVIQEDADDAGYTVEDYLRPYYDAALRDLKRRGESSKCWRAMILERDEDPRALDRLGVFWTTRKSSASPVWGQARMQGDADVLFEARVNPKGIDMESTLYNNLLFPDEEEIQFVPGIKLYVISATVRSVLSSEIYRVVPLKMWKRC